jgi:hypothetical protein
MSSCLVQHVIILSCLHQGTSIFRFIAQLTLIDALNVAFAVPVTKTLTLAEIFNIQPTGISLIGVGSDGVTTFQVLEHATEGDTANTGELYLNPDDPCLQLEVLSFLFLKVFNDCHHHADCTQ